MKARNQALLEPAESLSFPTGKQRLKTTARRAIADWFSVFPGALDQPRSQFPDFPLPATSRGGVSRFYCRRQPAAVAFPGFLAALRAVAGVLFAFPAVAGALVDGLDDFFLTAKALVDGLDDFFLTAKALVDGLDDYSPARGRAPSDLAGAPAARRLTAAPLGSGKIMLAVNPCLFRHPNIANT